MPLVEENPAQWIASGKPNGRREIPLQTPFSLLHRRKNSELEDQWELSGIEARPGN
jgi:hypothetical protein